MAAITSALGHFVRSTPTGSAAPRSRPSSARRDGIARCASDRLAPKRSATGLGARQRPLPDAEICGGEVSFLTSLLTSFDHLVGAGEQRERESDAERALAALGLMTS